MRDDLGPGKKYIISMVYPDPQLSSDYNLKAYGGRLYIADLLSVVEEWQMADVNRIAIVSRPQGKGKAPSCAGGFFSDPGIARSLSEGFCRIHREENGSR